MASKIYSGYVEHERLQPVKHGFRTKVGFVQIDLKDFSTLDRKVKGFGFNRFSPASIRSADYLHSGPGCFIEKLQPWINQIHLNVSPASISLVTSPRWWGQVFNPVSFYLLRDQNHHLQGLIAEVNNTFGDRHIYPVKLEASQGIDQGGHSKEFHVSPFNDMEGSYQFTVRESDEELYIGVDLYKAGEKFLVSWIEGKGKTLDSKSLWRHYLRHPLQPWLTMPRIVWQAALLKFRRGLQVFKRPEPNHPGTVLHRKHPSG